MALDFRYKFLKGVPHEFTWLLSLLVESEEETVTVAADFKHSLAAGSEEGDVRWTLQEQGRRGPDLALPPYLRNTKMELSLSERGVPAPGSSVPCFLLPAFPEGPIQKGSEWNVTDSSSGMQLEHTFTVLELQADLFRLVGDAALENPEFEMELGGDYTFSARQGRLVKAKVVIDTYRKGATRNLALEMTSAD